MLLCAELRISIILNGLCPCFEGSTTILLLLLYWGCSCLLVHVFVVYGFRGGEKHQRELALFIVNTDS